MPFFQESRDVFCCNLPWNFSERQLHELASAHGEVVRCRLATDHSTGNSRGFGFVRFRTEAEARTAIGALNGKLIEVQSLVPRPAEARAAHTDRPGKLS